MSYTLVIPARYASTRLPGKPLHDIAGKPLIQWVWENASRSSAERVVLAVDDDRVLRACRGFGAEVVMTDPQLASGTDRVCVACEQLQLGDDTSVVNVQGDEPLLCPGAIDRVVQGLLPETDMATLACSLTSNQDFASPDVVKVVVNADGCALYFSRAPIPCAREAPDQVPMEALRHIGVYAYKLSWLRWLKEQPPSSLEQVEMLEQLRALQAGARIAVQVLETQPGLGVDTAEDAQRVTRLLEQDA